MIKFSLFIPLAILLFLGCDTGLGDESNDKESSSMRYHGDYKDADYNIISDTYWEVVKCEKDGVIYNSPGKRYGYDLSHQMDPNHDYNKDDSMVYLMDCDGDGVDEWIDIHQYYFFNWKSAIQYTKEVLNDKGEVRGELVKQLYGENNSRIFNEMYPVHTDFTYTIEDGVMTLRGSEGKSKLYYNYNEMYMVDEKGWITTLKRVYIE